MADDHWSAKDRPSRASKVVKGSSNDFLCLASVFLPFHYTRRIPTPSKQDTSGFLDEPKILWTRHSHRAIRFRLLASGSLCKVSESSSTRTRRKRGKETISNSLPQVPQRRHMVEYPHERSTNSQAPSPARLLQKESSTRPYSQTKLEAGEKLDLLSHAHDEPIFSQDTETHPQAASHASPWCHLLAGAAAGTISRTATAPLEVLRLQAITGTASDKNLLAAAKYILKRNGWRALYRGNFLNVVRAAPQKALDFFSFEIYKGLLGARGAAGMGPTFTAAGLAGTTSTLALHPLEVLRSRITCDTSGQYKGLVDATRQIVRNEGVGALYRGLGPSMLAIIPEAALTYGMFDGLKRLYAHQTKAEKVGLLPSIACGVASSFTGQMVAFPLEAISRRLQVERAAVAKLGTLAFVTNILKKQGPLSLYRGVGAAVLKVIPMAAISFTTYEIMCLWLTRLETEADSKSRAGLQLKH